MAKMLILRLEGVLQSWGERSSFDNRDSAVMPTKSGVTGLLACALGWPRGDARIALLNSGLRMAVRADRSGTLMTDFHTVTGSKGYLYNVEGKKRVGEPTLLTPRQYLEDACFTVALAGEEATIDACDQALQNPVWQIYLGRKSCVPTYPVRLGVLSFDSLEKAMREMKRARRSDDDALPCEIEIDPERLEDRRNATVRHDALRGGGARYDVRYVRLETVNPPRENAQQEKEEPACI